jgi:hypothetical protein
MATLKSAVRAKFDQRIASSLSIVSLKGPSPTRQGRCTLVQRPNDDRSSLIRFGQTPKLQRSPGSPLPARSRLSNPTGRGRPDGRRGRNRRTLEGVAKPEAACLSEDAYRRVKAWLDLAANDPNHLRRIT